jgi:cysteinyl-tRNA synthetase
MLKLYNSLTKQKEEFEPINQGKVGMYVCGPTVYEYCHLGHARGYVSMDILRRYLEYLGFEVRHIMNYTDVGHLVDDAETGEDKIEKRAKKEKIDPLEIADKFVDACKEDFQALNIKPAQFNPRPTQYIAQIISFVSELINRGFAYEAKGSVYFSVDKFPSYGKLSRRKKEDLVSGARVEINPDKKNPLDFALWIKASKGHILKWESPWSLGYPGWHIECSVMSADLLGQSTFDIHGGGNENAFPHNENEIAQSEAYLGTKMANFWVLWNMVVNNGQKMSKSLGNYTTIRDALKKYNPMAIRLWILSSQYRSVLDFSEPALEQAQVNLKKISNFISGLKNISETGSRTDTTIDSQKYQERFEEALNDDLNLPLAMSVIYELISEANKKMAGNSLTQEDAKNILSLWERINRVLGLKLEEAKKEIPKEIIDLAEKRKEAKEKKDFEKSDEIRKKIEEKGFLIKDTKENNYIISKR